MICKAAYDTLKGMENANWREKLRGAYRDRRALLRELDLEHGDLERDGLEPSSTAEAGFGLKVPADFVRRMEKGNPRDPLLLQVWPGGAEARAEAGFCRDPLGEAALHDGVGLLRKYHGRVLLIATGHCAIHCRYCFRRHFPYRAGSLAPARRKALYAALCADRSITEVILSGGDPLSLDDEKLRALLDMLASVPHVRRLRIHSRFPVVLPARITDELLSLLLGCRLTPILVIHGNHPNEIDAEVLSALDRCRRAGLVTLNQAVLLAGINDEADTIAALNERLFEAGVLPYYLHLLDRVSGAAHFEVPEDRAGAIMETLRRRLPGYLVPKPVREAAGIPYKLPVL